MFRTSLIESILSEKKRAFQVEHLMYEDDDRRQAEELAETVMALCRVRMNPLTLRVTVDYGGLEEDVGEWLIEAVN